MIKDDYIEIESIDGYIKLKDREGASDGQTLSIGYCFLGTLFEEAELEFPFVIDSPTGKWISISVKQLPILSPLCLIK